MTDVSTEIVYRKAPGGVTLVELMLGEEKVSDLSIIPFTIRVGVALVRMDGIGGVNTDDSFRRRGFARQILNAAVARMRQGSASISMLYGISGFYPKFGYATAGPDHLIRLTELSPAPKLPAGWRVRPMRKADLPAAHLLYASAVRGSVGTAVRAERGPTWTRLAERASRRSGGDCRALEGPSGILAGYAWLDEGGWYKENLEQDYPDSMVISEVVAPDAPSAEVMLAACRLWGQEKAKRRDPAFDTVIVPAPPDSLIARAAMREAAEVVSVYADCGGSMVRVMDAARLLREMSPELAMRLEDAGFPFAGDLVVRTDIGDATIPLSPAGSVQTPRPAGACGPFVSVTSILEIPQQELARLALGAFPPDDILDRIPNPPHDPVRRMVRVLFPQRYPHMYLPDRF